MDILKDIATWPLVLYNDTMAGNYGALGGLAVAYYFLGNPLGQGQDLMQLVQSYALYGGAVVGGGMLLQKK